MMQNSSGEILAKLNSNISVITINIHGLIHQLKSILKSLPSSLQPQQQTNLKYKDIDKVMERDGKKSIRKVLTKAS